MDNYRQHRILNTRCMKTAFLSFDLFIFHRNAYAKRLKPHVTPPLICSILILACSMSLGSKSMLMTFPFGTDSASFAPRKPSPHPTSRMTESSHSPRRGTRTLPKQSSFNKYSLCSSRKTSLISSLLQKPSAKPFCSELESLFKLKYLYAQGVTS
jgi:hypothetical protein